ncbi:hypothetical protein GCM10022405_01210 [Gibbsiella dentisursi]|uniref:Uncharacterized protein n=1 Tax=Gibbsiella dentisursi TaxID=796890 RepID=A0ABP7KL65_9GAMM
MIFRVRANQQGTAAGAMLGVAGAGLRIANQPTEGAAANLHLPGERGVIHAAPLHG